MLSFASLDGSREGVVPMIEQRQRTRGCFDGRHGGDCL